MSFNESALGILGLATAVGLAGAALGLWLTSLRQRARLVVPFSAGVLLGVAILGLMPELAAESGWPLTLALAGGGWCLLFLANRSYSICPTCSHDHYHASCSMELHGFAAPLISGAALHSFLDGWGIAASQWAATPGVRIAVPLAVALHKLPEGIALGGILLASMKRRSVAMAWCAVAEGATLVGGAAGLFMAPYLGARWTIYPLGLAAGWLCFLGYHAVHEEWKRRGATPTFSSAAAGMVGAGILQRGAEQLFR